jgi:thymidylate kinase
MALIVLEGCDGAGKTTLAKSLAKIMDAQIIHCTTETPNNLDFFYQIIQMADDKNIIADRWCYGQFVYQTEEERKEKGWLDEYQLRELELEMLRNNVKVVHVIAPPSEIEERLALRNEKTAMPVQEILDLFSYYLNKSIVPCIEWDTGEAQWFKRSDV